MENEVVAPDTIDPTPPEAEIKTESVEVETKAEPLSRAEVIREALKKDTKEPKEAKAERPSKFPTPASRQEKPVVQAPDMPKSLKLEMKAHWEKAPPELRQAIAQREADFERGITNYKSRDAEAKSITDLFQPYEWMLRNENATPATAIAPLLQTAALLRTGTPQQKSQAVAQMIQQFQIPLDQVASHFNGQAPQPQDNHYNQLAQQVQQLTQHITQSQYEAQKQNESRALSVIQQFADDTANSHFEAVQDRMLSLLQAPHILGDTGLMSEREKLQLAYDTAIRLDPAISQQMFAQQQQNLQAQNQTQRAKAAAVQIKGAPSAGLTTALNQTDRRAVIANALRTANY